MTVGIPKAFLYYRYHVFWETFFSELGIDYVVSEDTNKELIRIGTNAAIDESCLSSKIYLGHVESLLDKCDYILIPRIATLGGSKDIVCSKFQAIYDVCKTTFSDRNIKILYYSIDKLNKETELKAFLKMGKFLGKKKSQILLAYYTAKQAEKTDRMIKVHEQEKLLESSKTKILIVSHPYNIYDAYIGKNVVDFLEEMDCSIIYGDRVDEKEAIVKAKEISKTLPWTYNKELVGSIGLYKDRVDGVILISSFPCGPDSLVNEMIIRKFHDKPIISLVLDSQEGTAGLETRLESFVDIIRLRGGNDND